MERFDNDELQKKRDDINEEDHRNEKQENKYPTKEDAETSPFRKNHGTSHHSLNHDPDNPHSLDQQVDEEQPITPNDMKQNPFHQSQHDATNQRMYTQKETAETHNRIDVPPSVHQKDDGGEADPFIIMKEEEQKQPKRRHWPYLLSGFIGGLIATILVFVLLSNAWITIPGLNLESEIHGTESTSTDEVEQDVRPVIAAPEDDVSYSIDDAAKAVVGIINLQQRNIWTPNEEAGAGSGIIYKKEGDKAFIVTNYHVVADAEVVEVDINNEERLEARVLGTDPLTDLAVLEIDGTEIEYVAELGSSSDIHVGQTVYAIGNPLGVEFYGTVTKGIVSGLDRSVKVDTTGNRQPDWITEVIQTDAAINPGNSGGALVDSSGKVVGINSMKIANQVVEGIGFAIPIDTAIPIMEELKEKGEVTRPYIGIYTAELYQVPMQYRHQIILPNDVEGGIVVANVSPRSPAEEAGLRQFDVITKINGHDIHSMLDLRKYLYSEVDVGDIVEIEYYRNGELNKVDLQLKEQQPF